MAGLELYVSHRAMLWHHNDIGGKSASIVYGSHNQWIAKGMLQAREDLEEKYGSDWRKILPGPEQAFLPGWKQRS